MIALLSLLLLAPFASAEAPELAVLAATPAGPAQSPTPPDAIVATFNQPMVSLATSAPTGEFCPIRIRPRVRGRCLWQGTQTLSFEPSEPLADATQFHVTIPAGTASKVTSARIS